MSTGRNATVKHYRSFLVRCWDLAGGDRRLEVQLVQTGERAVFATTQEVAAWIDTHNPHGQSPEQSAIPTRAAATQPAHAAGTESTE
jgi:hypothetical protein